MDKENHAQLNILMLISVMLIIAVVYLAFQVISFNARAKELDRQYGIVVSSDVVNVPPSDVTALLLAPPDLFENVLRNIRVVQGEVVSISDTQLVLNAKMVDAERVLAAGIPTDERGRVFQKIETLTIAITPLSEYLLREQLPRPDDAITVVTFEPALFSKTLNAKYIYPTIPGLTN